LYGVFTLCPVSPSTDEIESGLAKFCDDILRKYEILYDAIVIEEQPFIFDPRRPNDHLMNFRLQQIDIGLRGLVMGLNKELEVVRPNSVRCYLGTSTGNYLANKQEHIKYCKNMGLDFTELPLKKRCHVADTVCNAIYLLSKIKKKIRLDELGQSPKCYRTFSKGFEKRDAQSVSTSSSTSEERCRISNSQENNSSG
jgi:hypothetical protein